MWSVYETLIIWQFYCKDLKMADTKAYALIWNRLMLDGVGGFDIFAPLVLGSLVECYGGTTVDAVVELCFQAEDWCT